MKYGFRFLHLTGDNGAERLDDSCCQTAPAGVLTSPAECYSDVVIVESKQLRAVDVTPDMLRIFHFYIRIYCRLRITPVGVVLPLGDRFACDFLFFR